MPNARQLPVPECMTFVPVDEEPRALGFAPMKIDQDLGRRLGRFAAELPALCAKLKGDSLVDAVHRLYEHVLCETPRELLDPAHDAMHMLMHRHGLVRRPPTDWATARKRS